MLCKKNFDLQWTFLPSVVKLHLLLLVFQWGLLLIVLYFGLWLHKHGWGRVWGCAWLLFEKGS